MDQVNVQALFRHPQRCLVRLACLVVSQNSPAKSAQINYVVGLLLLGGSSHLVSG